jgi:serine/threonine protein kinase
LSEPDVRSVIGQLAAVLGYLHDQGICHRDLKPANVLFNSRGELKLADFGLARSACCSDLTARHELLGTPCYMAPEQLQGDRADCRADLFAVGCLVWEMLTGNRLFDGASVLAIALQQAKFSLADADVIRPGLSRDIYEVLSGSLVREPQDRTLDLKRLAAWSSVIC